MEQPVQKVVVAVHGIGDQTRFATIQQVLAQFSLYHGQKAAVPLGNFHVDGDSRVFIPKAPESMQHYGFAEVYWADIPRALVEKKHVLEDIQPWVHTIVGRLRQRHQEELSPEDVELVEQVLGEMLQTIGVMERLCFLADKMGVFSFDLKKVLVDFLDDVQVVAEFRQEGGKIGKAFAEQMDAVHKQFSGAQEIYLIAHSEGTVVTLLGLLTALCDPDNPWISKVRGLMTLGSPIDKHLILWPELFESFQTPAPNRPPAPIVWHNYYDKGDPVGFALETARKRFTEGSWKGIFAFGPENDHGFARFPMPGKAHNDYWQDPQVFGHFIENVVDVPPPSKERKHPAPIPSKLLPQLVSWVLPYAGALALLFLATLVLDKAVYGLSNEKSEAFRPLFGTVLSFTCLLAGITVIARIPRLTKSWVWRGAGVLVFLLFAGGYWLCATKIPAGEPFAMSYLLIAGALALATWGAAILFPSWGMRTLLIPGVLAVAYVVYTGFLQDSKGELWPVFPAAAVFLYLWWLVALIFDLTFVWHRYIRWGTPIVGEKSWVRANVAKAAVMPPATTAAGSR
jgi:hypothetical protein